MSASVARPSRSPLPLDHAVIALALTRVSSDEQADEGVSLPAQLSECRWYVGRRAEQGWISGDEFQDVMSGKRDDRPGYQRMLMTIRRLALEGRRVVVVVASLDRLGRDIHERVRAYKELKALGVEIHSVREGGVVSELTYNILASVAQEEVRKLSERVRGSIRHFEANGWHSVGAPAWGYALRERTKGEKDLGAPRSVLVPHETEAPYVKEAWRMFADGATIRAVARWAGGLPVEARGGRNLSFQVVRKVLRSPVYAARVGGPDLKADADALLAVLDQEVGRWDALVDDATWERAAERQAMARRLPRQASGAFALTGLLRCARCGDRMSGRTQKRRDRAKPAYRQYVCNAHVGLGARTGGSPCQLVVTADAVERAVSETVRELLESASRPDIRARAASALDRRRRAERAGSEAYVRRIATAEQQRKKAVAARAGLTVNLAAGDITKEAYDEALALLAERIDEADRELAEVRGRVRTPDEPPLDALLSQVDGFARALESADPAARREVYAVLLKRVEPVRVAIGRYEARLDWTPLGLALLGAAVEGPASANVVAVETSGLTRVSTPTTAPAE